MERVSEGAEAVIYAAEIGGSSLIIKTRQPKPYRAKELDEYLRASRTRREAKLLQKARESGVPVPRVAAVGRHSIFMERLGGRLLKDAKAGAKELTAIGKCLAQMHNSGIVHGDFTAANVLLSRNGISIIDFGLGEFSNNVEEKALDLLLIERSIAKSGFLKLKHAYVSKSENPGEIFGKLKEIKRRGRYQLRTLA